MQVFLPYTDIIQVAKCLDKRRLHKQIVECRQIIKAIRGESEAWKNHPIVKMYKNNIVFLQFYLQVLEEYWDCGENDKERLELFNYEAQITLPKFINEEYLNTMKGRLYRKDPIYYVQFAPFINYGDKNMYFVDGEWKIYKQK